eukprot:gene7042-7787_t
MPDLALLSVETDKNGGGQIANSNGYLVVERSNQENIRNQVMSSASSHRTRREARQRLLSIQNLLRTEDLSVRDQDALKKEMKSLRETINADLTDIDRDEIAKRRKFVEGNPGLRDIFHAMWMIFFPYTLDGVLTKEGYKKFHQAMDIALVGRNSFEDLLLDLESDWEVDCRLFGQLDKHNFFDFLFETIETYAGTVNPSFYTAFAWALLDGIADTSLNPPKLRPLREISCITETKDEAKVVATYLRDKKLRSKVVLTAASLSRVPEVQLRLQGRRRAHAMGDAQQKMVEAITIGVPLAKANDNDNDENSLVSEGSGPGSSKGDPLCLSLDVDDKALDNEEHVDAQPSYFQVLSSNPVNPPPAKPPSAKNRPTTFLSTSGPSGIDRPIVYESPFLSMPISEVRERKPNSPSKFARFMMNRGITDEDDESTLNEKRDQVHGFGSSSSTTKGLNKAAMVPNMGNSDGEPGANEFATAHGIFLSGKGMIPSGGVENGGKLKKGERVGEHHHPIWDNTPLTVEEDDFVLAFFEKYQQTDKKKKKKSKSKPSSSSSSSKSGHVDASFLSVANNMPYYLVGQKAGNKTLSPINGKSISKKNSSIVEEPTISLGRLSELTRSDYEFVMAEVQRRSQEKEKTKRGGYSQRTTTKSESQELFAAGDDTSLGPIFGGGDSVSDTTSNDVPTATGVVTSQEPFFMIESKEAPGFHDPFSLNNIKAFQHTLQRQQIAKEHLQMISEMEADSTFQLTQTLSSIRLSPSNARSREKEGRFESLLPDIKASSSRVDLPPLHPLSTSLASKSNGEGHLAGKSMIEKEEEEEEEGQETLQKFSDDISTKTMENSVDNRPPPIMTENIMEWSRSYSRSPLRFGISPYPSLSLTIHPVARSPPTQKLVNKTTKSFATKQISRLAEKKPAAEQVPEEWGGHFSAPSILMSSVPSASHFSKSSINAKSLLLPSNAPVAHPCHESFLHVTGSLSSTEFRAQQELAKTGCLAGCNTAPWNRKPAIDCFIGNRRDMMMAWKDKVDVLRAPPIYPVNRMLTAAREQRTTKKNFLAFVNNGNMPKS